MKNTKNNMYLDDRETVGGKISYAIYKLFHKEKVGRLEGEVKEIKVRDNNFVNWTE